MRILFLAVLALAAFVLGFWLTKTLQHRRLPSKQSGSQAESSPRSDRPRSGRGRWLETDQAQIDPILLHKLAQEVSQLLSERQKIAALRLVREQTRWGLKTAKDYVEAIERQESIAMRALATPHLPDDLPLQVRQLLDQRQMIAAIRLVREQTGWGLKAAKDYVEQIQTQR